MSSEPDPAARGPVNWRTEAWVSYTERFPLGASTTLPDGPHAIDGGHVVSINVMRGIIASRTTRDRPLNTNRKLSPELQAKLDESLARIKAFKETGSFEGIIDDPVA